MIHRDISADFQMKGGSLLNKHSDDWHHIEFVDSLIAQRFYIMCLWHNAKLYSYLTHAIGDCDG